MIIKFNQKYTKLKAALKDQVYPIAKLVQVLKINSNQLSEDFLKYDTSYYGGRYEIEKDKDYLLLFLLSPNGNIFTTLRSYSAEKEAYYVTNTGKYFDVYVTYKTPNKDGKPTK